MIFKNEFQLVVNEFQLVVNELQIVVNELQLVLNEFIIFEIAFSNIKKYTTILNIKK